MDEKLIEIIKQDIKRCEQQTSKAGSYQLYQALVGKYNGVFEHFSEDIPKMGKISVGEPFDYRPELNAIKEKLELILITEQAKDPLYKFKEMLSDDIQNIEKVLDDVSFSEEVKKQLYASVTAKYHPYVPKFAKGLYEVYEDAGLYEEITGETLEYNLSQIKNKLIVFQALNYPGLCIENTTSPSTFVSITNNNENKNTMNLSFNEARERVNKMASLSEDDIGEIQNRINQIEEIVTSKDTKIKKWSKANEIIKWIADKGVDVGISLLPLLLNIG